MLPARWHPERSRPGTSCPCPWGASIAFHTSLHLQAVMGTTRKVSGGVGCCYKLHVTSLNSPNVKGRLLSSQAAWEEPQAEQRVVPAAESCCLTRPPGISRAAAACHLYGGILGVAHILVCQRGCAGGTCSAPAAGAQRGGTRSGWGRRGAASGAAGTSVPRALWQCPAGGGLSAVRCVWHRVSSVCWGTRARCSFSLD